MQGSLTIIGSTRLIEHEPVEGACIASSYSMSYDDFLFGGEYGFWKKNLILHSSMNLCTRRMRDDG